MRLISKKAVLFAGVGKMLVSPYVFEADVLCFYQSKPAFSDLTLRLFLLESLGLGYLPLKEFGLTHCVLISFYAQVLLKAKIEL